MGYTNSGLVDFKRLSPNHSGQREHAIDRISPHCVVGQCTAEGLGEWFSQTSTQAFSNYGIDRDGRIGLYVEEKNRSWCTSSKENDKRAVTIECASDLQEPYWMNEKVYLEDLLLYYDWNIICGYYYVIFMRKHCRKNDRLFDRTNRSDGSRHKTCGTS